MTSSRLLALGPALLLVGCSADPCAPEPNPDTLTWVQLPLRGSIGEAALVLAPSGQVALVDVGNDSHADEVQDAVRAWTGDERVDHLILTHFHADHVGALSELGERLQVERVVSRGLVHLDDANEAELAGLDALLSTGARHDPLCSSAGCELDEPLDLGGPQIHWLAADAQDREGPLVGGALEENALEENARSLVGVLEWAGFRLLFGGDLTGGGKGTPDLETPLASRAPLALWPAEGVQVMQANHHGIRSSSNPSWVARAFPAGRDHNLLVGAGPGYGAAPHGDVLDEVADALGDGFVFASGLGGLAGSHPRLRASEGAVVVRVASDGSYSVRFGEDGQCQELPYRRYLSQR